MMQNVQQKLKRQKGGILVIFAYFIPLVLLPLMAMAYDLSQMYIFRQHLTNITQLAALSCMSHAKGFDAQKCVYNMTKVILVNTNMNNGTGKRDQFLFGGADQFESSNTARSIDTGAAKLKGGMQTEIFDIAVKGERNAKSRFILDAKQTANGNKTAEQISRLSMTQFSNDHLFPSNPQGHGYMQTLRSNLLYLRGYYRPFFGGFFLTQQQQQVGIPIRSEAVSVQAKFVR